MTASIRGIATPYESTGPTITLPVPFALNGDHVYMLAVAYATFADTTAPVSDWEVPDGWALSADVPILESATAVGRFGCFTIKVDGAAPSPPVITNPCNATQKLGFSTGISVRDVGGAPGVGCCSLDLTDIGLQ